jgi:dolichol-phosphate mannosyltransferase
MLASNAPYLAVMDCDFQHDPAVLRVMYETLASGMAELVVGSRYIDGGSCGNWSKQRREISKMATRLSRLVLSQNVMDPMSNFFALRRELFDEAANDLSGLSFKILLDLMLTVGRPVRFCEIPIVLGQRSAGESKFEIIVAWEFGMLLADKTIGRYIPMRFLLLLVNGAILGGAFLAGYVLTYKGVGLGFVSSGVMAVLGSMVTAYSISNVVAYEDRRRHGLSWLRGLLAFFVLNGVGAAASVVFANYLFNTGAGWLVAVAAGMLLWLAWDFSGASSQRWRLGGQFFGSVRRARNCRRRRNHLTTQ